MANTRDAQRTKARDLMKSRKGKNGYTQGSKRTYFFGYPDNQVGNTTQKGYSDCSSAARAAIKAASGIDIGSNTSAQINNRKKKGKVVHETTGYYPDESKLKIGDCLYFKGNTSHPLDVGHVEMYTGPNECTGHGSGTGPKVKNLKDYCKSRATAKRRYFMAIRWIPDEEENVTPPDATLSYGDEGEDVRIMQMSLIALGYNLGSYGADGDFGPDTKAALIAFQENVRISPTGIYDAETRERMLAALDSVGDTDEEEALPMPVQNAITIANGSWNVRTGPGTEFAAAGVVRGGEQYEKVDLGGWTPIIFNGRVCFIGPKAVKK